jgi:hypothetical protein
MGSEQQDKKREPFNWAAHSTTVFDPDQPGDAVDDPGPPDFEPPKPTPGPPSMLEDDDTSIETGIPTAPKSEAAPPTHGLRFATHEEAEAGYANLFQRYQEATKSLKTVKDGLSQKASDDYDRALKDARLDQFRGYVKDRSLEHQTAIEALDPNADDYNFAVADLEASFYADVERFKQSPPDLDPTNAPAKPSPDSHGVEIPADLPADPATQVEQYVLSEFGRRGISKDDAFVAHLSQGLPQVGTQLDDGRVVTIPVQVELLVDRLSDETLKRYCAQSHDPNLPELGADDPVLQHFVSKAATVDAAGQPIPFYARLQGAVRKAREYQLSERQRILSLSDMPLPHSSGPGAEKGRSGEKKGPSSLASVLDRVYEDGRIK